MQNSFLHTRKLINNHSSLIIYMACPTIIDEFILSAVEGIFFFPFFTFHFSLLTFPFSLFPSHFSLFTSPFSLFTSPLPRQSESRIPASRGQGSRRFFNQFFTFHFSLLTSPFSLLSPTTVGGCHSRESTESSACSVRCAKFVFAHAESNQSSLIIYSVIPHLMRNPFFDFYNACPVG